jgi:tRNA nucleotidyltransferase (CCA-adding enzyme)
MDLTYPVAPEAHLILSRLISHGYEAYLVGGSVRDQVLGRPITDLDITTNASTSEVLALFSDHKTSRIGERLGTIGIQVHSSWIEVTTYRIDSSSSNARHPDSVTFTGSLLEDLKRRDFTINALVMDRYGCVKDPLGGLADLNAKIIRAIGNPDDRFNEDALRLLRALRFGAQLGFTIDHDTGKALLRHQALLDTLPVERIRTELDKLIRSDSLETIFYPYFSVLARVMAISPQGLAGFEHFDRFELKLLTLLEHLSPQAIHHELLRLKYPKRFADRLAKLAAHRHASASTAIEIKRLLKDVGREGVELILTYQDVHGISGIDPDLAAAVTAQDPVVTLNRLAINGHDLMALGIQGKTIQITLDRLLEGVIEESLPNRPYDLLKAARAFLDEKG